MKPAVKVAAELLGLVTRTVAGPAESVPLESPQQGELALRGIGAEGVFDPFELIQHAHDLCRNDPIRQRGHSALVANS